MLKLFKRKKKDTPRIVKRSNVIQYDEMGYPLRWFCCKVSNLLSNKVEY